MTNVMMRSTQFILHKARHLKLDRRKNKLLPKFDNFSFLRSRKTIRHVHSSKVFFIMRGLPGSGKSTLVRAIKSHFKEAVVCSADSFFVQEDGSYAYDLEKLPQAHEECASLAQQSAEIGVRHIVIDNTNILRWELGKYLKLANEFGYAVVVIEPKTPWNLEPTELAARNTHGCTVEVVEQKLKKFKAILPVYWGWFFNETVSSELLMLGETCFELCMKTIPDFASYMSELGVSKGLTFPLTFREFYNCSNSSLLHCTSFFSGMNSSRSPGTDEYADRLEVQRSMGKAFSLKLAGITFTPRTAGIRVILNKRQQPLWGAEDVWYPQPPPKTKAENAAQSTDGSDALMQNAPKMKNQKRDKKRRSDNSKLLKRDENDTKSGAVITMDALDSDDILLLMAPNLSDTDLAQDPTTGISSSHEQSAYKMSPYPGSSETASYLNDFKIEEDQGDNTLVLDRVGSKVSTAQNYSEMALSENDANFVHTKSDTTVTVAATSVGTMPKACAVVGDDGTVDSVKETFDLKVGESFPCLSCLESNSTSVSCQKHHSDISTHKSCEMTSLSVENVDENIDKFSLILSTCHEELSDIPAENICKVPPIHEENKSDNSVDKSRLLTVLTDSASLQDHLEQLPKTIDDVILADFHVKSFMNEDAKKLSNISILQPLENNTSIMVENSTDISASDICPEPAQSKHSTAVEGSSDEVPRIQLKRGSRAHMTLGCAEGYKAVETGFDQMELLMCEDNELMVGESVVTNDVEITYYGAGRCTVYFDWPIYRSALFTGKY